MVQRRNRRSGIEDRWHKRDGSPSKLHHGDCVKGRRCDGVGKRWRARYVNAEGDERAQIFATKPQAVEWLDKVAGDIASGRYVDPQRQVITFGEVAKAWKVNPSWTATTRERNLSVLRMHVLPRWGDLRLSAVKHEDLQIWVNELVASGLSSGSVRKIVGVARGVLQMAMRNGRVSMNPADHLQLPRQKVARRRYLTVGQVDRLAQEAGSHEVIVLVLAYCGLRIGELSALRVGNVDRVRRRFMVEASVTEVNGELVWSDPKDHQRRSVPWPRFLDDEIDALIVGRDAADLLFPSPRGDVLRVRNMRRSWFDRAARDAGVSGLTPHELRHTAASIAVSAGASVLAVQRMLGHDKPSTTLNVYSDLFDHDLDDLADRLAAARGQHAADNLRTIAPLAMMAVDAEVA